MLGRALLLSSSPYPYPNVTSSLISYYPRSIIFVQFLTLYTSNHTICNLLCLAFFLLLIMFVIHSCSCLSIPFCRSILEPMSHCFNTFILYLHISNNKAIVINTALFFFRIALALLNSFQNLSKYLLGFLKIRITLKL